MANVDVVLGTVSKYHLMLLLQPEISFGRVSDSWPLWCKLYIGRFRHRAGQWSSLRRNGSSSWIS